MAFDPKRLDGFERRRYVLAHAPSILCALIVRRNSTDPEHLIDLAIETASSMYDKIEPGWNPNGKAENIHTNGSA